MHAADARATAQVLFVTVDEPEVRFDVVLLDDAVWGHQRLAAGSPISISFDVAHAQHRTTVMTMARGWAAVLAPIDLIFDEDGGQHQVTLAAGDERLVLSMSPFP